VLGPEKLPRVVSELGRWVGRARAMARQFREQLEEEVQLEQARRAQAQTPPPVEPSTYHGPTPPAPPAPPPSSPPAAAVSTHESGPTPSADERGT
jgi:sec-independent protein translocase protein TatB